MDNATLIERLRSSAQAFRENTVYTSDGDAIRLGVQAAEFNEAADRIEQLERELMNEEPLYCPACGSCGDIDCGCTHKCKFAFAHPEVADRIEALENRILFLEEQLLLA